jgi:hypothetical protein
MDLMLITLSDLLILRLLMIQLIESIIIYKVISFF